MKKTKNIPQNILKNELQHSAIITKGLDVFENMADFQHWLETENRALNGEIPFKLLAFSKGEERVLEVLGRIEHGIYS